MSDDKSGDDTGGATGAGGKEVNSLAPGKTGAEPVGGVVTDPGETARQAEDASLGTVDQAQTRAGAIEAAPGQQTPLTPAFGALYAPDPQADEVAHANPSSVNPPAGVVLEAAPPVWIDPNADAAPESKRRKRKA